MPKQTNIIVTFSEWMSFLCQMKWQWLLVRHSSLPSICSCMSRIVPHSINERVTSQMVSWQPRRRCWRCYSTQGFSFKIAWWRMVETHKAFWVFGPEVIWWPAAKLEGALLKGCGIGGRGWDIFKSFFCQSSAWNFVRWKGALGRISNIYWKDIPPTIFGHFNIYRVILQFSLLFFVSPARDCHVVLRVTLN